MNGPTGTSIFLLANDSDAHLMAREQLAQAHAPSSHFGQAGLHMASRTLARQLGEAVEDCNCTVPARTVNTSWVRMRGPRAPSGDRG